MRTASIQRFEGFYVLTMFIPGMRREFNSFFNNFGISNSYLVKFNFVLNISGKILAKKFLNVF